MTAPPDALATLADCQTWRAWVMRALVAGDLSPGRANTILSGVQAVERLLTGYRTVAERREDARLTRLERAYDRFVQTQHQT